VNENMSEQIVEETPEIETVMRNITLKLPKNFDNFLQGVAKIAGVSIEEVLLDALYGVLSNFLQGGYLENWYDWVMENRTDLEEQIRQIDC